MQTRRADVATGALLNHLLQNTYAAAFVIAVLLHTCDEVPLRRPLSRSTASVDARSTGRKS